MESMNLGNGLVIQPRAPLSFFVKEGKYNMKVLISYLGGDGQRLCTRGKIVTANGCVPVVRSPTHNPAFILRTLNQGYVNPSKSNPG